MNLAVHGAAGRMGRRIIALAVADPQWQLVAAWESAGHSRLGDDAGSLAGVEPLGVPLTIESPRSVESPLAVESIAAPDTVIDFSVPAAAVPIAERCAAQGWPLVVATTGFDTDARKRVERCAERIALLVSPNLSLAVNLAMKLAEHAAVSLAAQPGQVDVEIIERHHRFKEDAPSGTALRFGQLIAAQMGQATHRHGREGRPGVRPVGEIGYHAIRAGDHPGEHHIIFGLLGEAVEISVSATSRDAYAHGALLAARYLVGKPPGLYSTAEVFGL